MAKCAFRSTDLQINRLTNSRERLEIKFFKIETSDFECKKVVKEELLLLYRIYKKKIINKALKCSSTKKY